MLLGFSTFTDQQGTYTDLCIIPRDEDRYSSKFRVRLMKPCAAAVYHIGPKEAVIVNKGDEPNSIVITPCQPAPLYLTPESPSQPGLRVAKIMIIITGDDFKTYYIAKETAGKDLWKEWVANRLRTE